jgi:hypothetical protein
MGESLIIDSDRLQAKKESSLGNTLGVPEDKWL